MTKDPEGNLVWLENSDSGSDWVHIRDDHRDHFRSEFPSVGDGELTIADLVYEAVKNPHHTEPNPGGGIRYYHVVDGSEIRVATGDNGYVITAHPDT